jgi:hypothetical protein
MKHPVYGQMITFAIETDEDARLKKFRKISTRPGDTAQRIANRNGNPDDASLIKRLNKLGSITKVIRHSPRRKKDKLSVKVPGNFKSNLRFNVMPGATAPVIAGGYAKFSTVDRPDLKGIPKFEGYDPAVLSVPIRFESVQGRGDQNLEIDVALLERMAGRGQFSGAGAGPPPIINVSVTNGSTIVPLIPNQWQRSSQNPQGPLWRVTGIDWGDSVRDRNGVLLRQLATVTLTEHVRARFQTKSAKSRNRQKRGKGTLVGTVVPGSFEAGL